MNRVPYTLARALAWLIPTLLACATPTPPDAAPPGAGGDPVSAEVGGSGGQGGQGGAHEWSGVEDCAPATEQCTVVDCIEGACVTLPADEGLTCWDGKLCSSESECQEGKCVATALESCPQNNPCAMAKCDLETDSCIPVPINDGAACVDTNPCTVTGQCSAGVCEPLTSVDCSSLDGDCTLGTCDPNVGCVALPINDGAPCEDGMFCTTNELCRGGVCSGEPYVCPTPETPCMVAECNEGLDGCFAESAANGTPCDDGSNCTENDACSSLGCTGVPTNDGAPCDDGDSCSTGTTCQSGACTDALDLVSSCIDADGCCPPGCVGYDSDCYWATGVQQNVPLAALTGWSICFQTPYSYSGASIPFVVSQCDKPKLLMACGLENDPTYKLVAMAPRPDVLFECSTLVDCVHEANGVGWYWSELWSWGFAPGGLPANRMPCDLNDGTQISPELRLCLRTGGGYVETGSRCGDNDLTSGTGWVRAVYEAD